MGGQKASKTEDEVNKKLNEIKKNVDEIKENQLKFEGIVNANFKKFKREIIHELTVSIFLKNVHSNILCTSQNNIAN